MTIIMLGVVFFRIFFSGTLETAIVSLALQFFFLRCVAREYFV